MLNLPVPPHTRISRQLTCVSCHEQFTIAEDDPVRDESSSESNPVQNNSPAENVPVQNETPNDNRQKPADSYPDINLRYQEDRSRRPVVPENRAIPSQNKHTYEQRDDNHHSINCPRCGADNRNWLHILNPSHQHDTNKLQVGDKDKISPIFSVVIVITSFALGSASLAYMIAVWFYFPQKFLLDIAMGLGATAASLVIAFFLIQFLPANSLIKFRQWRQKFGTGLYGILITCALIVMAAYFHFHWDSGKIIRSITLLIVIGLAGIITTTRMLSTWLAQREYRYFTRVVPPASLSQKISPPLKVWLSFTALYLLIIPLLFYLIFPSGFYWLTTLGNPAPPEPPITLEQRINNILGELEVVLAEAPPGTIEPVAEAIDDLVAFLADVPMPIDALDNLTLEQRAVIVLAWTNDLLKNAPEEDKQSIRNAIHNLEVFIVTANLDTAVSEPTNTAASVTQVEQPPWKKLDKQFFNAWFKYVLAASIASLAFSMIAINEYVRRINQQLPPPIYHSLANMTRVVIWEAKRTLEIGDEIKYIQWTNAQRNEQGGIILEGFYRDDSLVDLPDSPTTTKVRAQRYQIVSDRWGRILSSNIKTAHVYRLPRRSLSTDKPIMSDFFSKLIDQPSEGAGNASQ